MRRTPWVQPPPRSLADLDIDPPPRRGAVSHQTAAAIHGLPLLSSRGRCLTLPPGFHARRCVEWEVHRSDIKPAELTETADGFPVTTLTRTVLDCARTLQLFDAVALLDVALNRELVQLSDLQRAAEGMRGPGSGALKRAVRLADGRADSAQESVARVALGQAGLPSEPQFALFEGDFEHHYDLGLAWAQLLIDLQSKEHHGAWSAVQRDIGHLQLVNVTPGWKLAFTTPEMVLPWPYRFVRAVLEIVVQQPGPRCRALRKRYLHPDGNLDLTSLTSMWPLSIT